MCDPINPVVNPIPVLYSRHAYAQQYVQISWEPHNIHRFCENHRTFPKSMNNIKYFQISWKPENIFRSRENHRTYRDFVRTTEHIQISWEPPSISRFRENHRTYPDFARTTEDIQVSWEPENISRFCKNTTYPDFVRIREHIQISWEPENISRFRDDHRTYPNFMGTAEHIQISWEPHNTSRFLENQRTYPDFMRTTEYRLTQFIHDISSTHKAQSIRDTENWFAFTWKNNLLSSIHLNVSAICRSQNGQTVLNFMPCVFQHLGCHRSNCIFDSFTKFNYTTNFWTEYLVLYESPKEKIQWGYIGRARGPRDWPVPPNSSVWKSFIQRLSHCKAPVCRGTILLKENVWLKVCHLRDCT
jgi:hypothetical protein